MLGVLGSRPRLHANTRRRRYVPVDHSAKYSLTFNEVKIGFFLTPIKPASGPDPLNVRVTIIIGNGLDIPIQAYIERMAVTVNGKIPNIPIGGVRKLRLLPGQTREYRAPLVLDISTGDVGGEVDYAIIYSPLNGVPAYRRTHKISFRGNRACYPVRAPQRESRNNRPGATWNMKETRICRKTLI